MSHVEEEVEFKHVTLTVGGTFHVPQGVTGIKVERAGWPKVGEEEQGFSFTIEVWGKNEKDAQEKLDLFRQKLAEAIGGAP